MVKTFPIARSASMGMLAVFVSFGRRRDRTTVLVSVTVVAAARQSYKLVR